VVLWEDQTGVFRVNKMCYGRSGPACLALKCCAMGGRDQSV